MDGKCIGDQKLWGGRFREEVDPELHILNASIGIDKRMYAEDIKGSIAYANALSKANLLTEDESKLICEGLEKMKMEWDEGLFELIPDDEDIHTANERRLTEIIGDTARKLNTGRSRNDQIATDTRLWLRETIDTLLNAVADVVGVLVARAERDIDVLIPGYTHMQRAQPVRWSHWLLSHAWSMKNDAERLSQIRKRVNVMPLGSGALAGNPFRIDRVQLAADLGFQDVTQNSMHAVGDRDFVAEFLFWASLTSVHLSRLSEDLIIYSSEEFGFIRLSDAFSTGSSLLPQKRNPDSMELIRGKTGTIFGKCVGFMMTLKGIPSTYNKDLQEDKESAFSASDTLLSMLRVASGALQTLRLNSVNCSGALVYDMLATDIAYYLVGKGIPFREAHHLAGEVVAKAEERNIALRDVSIQQLQSISPAFSEDVKKVWDFARSVEQYKVVGGTSLSAVQHQLKLLKSWICKGPVPVHR